MPLYRPDADHLRAKARTLRLAAASLDSPWSDQMRRTAAELEARADETEGRPVGLDADGHLPDDRT